MTKAELTDHEERLKRIIEESLPQMIQMCASTAADTVVLHQDAFAADYQPEEYVLLGMAIKYIGLSGKNIIIGGVNRSTLSGADETPVSSPTTCSRQQRRQEQRRTAKARRS